MCRFLFVRFLLYTAKIAPEYGLALESGIRIHRPRPAEQTREAQTLKARDGVNIGIGVFHPGGETMGLDYEDLTKAGGRAAQFHQAQSSGSAL